MNIAETDSAQGLPELLEGMTEGGAKSKTKGAVEGVKEKLGLGDSDEEDRRKKAPARRRSSSRSRRREDENE
jgi:hypothetical protein